MRTNASSLKNPVATGASLIDALESQASCCFLALGGLVSVLRVVDDGMPLHPVGLGSGVTLNGFAGPVRLLANISRISWLYVRQRTEGLRLHTQTTIVQLRT